MPTVAENEPVARKPKKPVEPDQPKGDPHLGAPFTMRLPLDMLTVLDKLADDSDRSRTGEIRLAIRKHLESKGLWPPAGDPDADQE